MSVETEDLAWINREAVRVALPPDAVSVAFDRKPADDEWRERVAAAAIVITDYAMNTW